MLNGVRPSLGSLQIIFTPQGSLLANRRLEALWGHAANVWCFVPLQGVERLGHPQHSLDAVLCACRQHANKLT